LLDVAKAGDDVAESGEKASKSTLNVGRAALEGSRAMEDLQYGIGGVLNNIPGLITMLGGPAGLAAAISLAAVAATQLVKHWDEITTAFKTKNAFPEMTGDVHELEAALAANGKELDALRQKHNLTNDQLARANFLIQERTKLEAEAEVAAATKRIRETKGEEQKGRGEPFQKLVDKVGGAQVLADIQAGVGKKYNITGDAARAMAEAILSNAIKGRQAARDELEDLLTNFGRQTQTGIGYLGPTQAVLPGLGPVAPEERKAEQKRKDDAAKKAQDVAAALKKKNDEKAAAARKAADKRELAEAKVMVENPEQTLALHGPEALAQAEKLVGKAAIAKPAGGAIPPGGPIPIAALPGFAPQGPAPLAGLKGPALIRAQEARRAQAHHAAELLRKTRAAFAVRAQPGRVIAAQGPPRAAGAAGQAAVDANRATLDAMGAVQQVQGKMLNDSKRQKAEAERRRREAERMKNNMEQGQPGGGNTG
jgi:hypothetical protein